MNFLILAAGSGKRLMPLTNDKPKCLVELNKKSLLNWQLEILEKIKSVSLNIVVGYKYQQIANLRDKRINKIFNNKDYKNTNMVKSLLQAKELFNECLIISYSDIVYSENVILKLLNSNFDNAIIIDVDWYKLWKKRFKNPLDDAETLIFDSYNNLLDIGRKTKNYNDIMGQYIGLMKFNKSTLEFILNLSRTKPIDNLFMTDLIQILIKNNINIKVLPIKRGWLEIDSVNDLEIYEKELEVGKHKSIFTIFS